MRILVDPETGELEEFLPEALIPLVPYSFREAKAAHMRASRERREAERAYKDAITELGKAEHAYRVSLAQEVVRQKAIVGATNAEQAAKGEPKVAEARERYTVAEGLKFSAWLRIQGCDEDRKGISQLVSWSRAVATGPWGEGQ